MLELHQFRYSAFCLKVRMVLEAKKLSYKVVEVTPGTGQLTIFQLSGQRQVPILVDGETVIHDSSQILRYLEKKSPEPMLLPSEPQLAAQVHLIENWADTTLAKAVRALLVQAAAVDPILRLELLPEDLPEPLQQIVGKMPGGLISGVTEFLNQGESAKLLTNLEQLSNLVETNAWLVGNMMSFADIAVAAQLSLLCFPSSAGENVAGKGCPGFMDHPMLQSLFKWRDQIDLSLFPRDEITTKAISNQI